MERISTRLLDELGRIALPSVSREAFGWEPGAPLDIFEDAANQQVVLRPPAACSAKAEPAFASSAASTSARSA